MIRTDRLTVTYPRRHPVLRDVAFALEKGSTAWVIGDNGSGKSTLSLALAGLIPEVVPATRRGTVTIGTRDPAALPARERVTAVGMVLQDPDAQVCTSSIESELAFTLENRAVPEREIVQRVAQTLREWDLSHLVDRPLSSLSGGEKQLVAIAAVAVAPPELLVVDEPASYLDEKHRVLLYRALGELRRRRAEMALLIVEHRTDGLPKPDVVFRCAGDGWTPAPRYPNAGEPHFRACRHRYRRVGTSYCRSRPLVPVAVG